MIRGSINRVKAHPLMATALFVMWLLLNQSFSLGHILLGILVTLIALRGVTALQPEPAKIRFSRAMLDLAGRVFWDVLESNWQAGKLILFGNGKPGGNTPGFIELPLELTSRYGLAVLAIILTATPGTLWVQYNAGRSTLLLHILDLEDPQYWIDLLKNRYEKLLLEIFE